MSLWDICRRNMANSYTKHFNECKAFFIKDNKTFIDEMREAIKNKERIEICSGPCAGMVIQTSYDIHRWIDMHVKSMVGY